MQLGTQLHDHGLGMHPANRAFAWPDPLTYPKLLVDVPEAEADTGVDSVGTPEFGPSETGMSIDTSAFTVPPTCAVAENKSALACRTPPNRTAKAASTSVARFISPFPFVFGGCLAHSEWASGAHRLRQGGIRLGYSLCSSRERLVPRVGEGKTRTRCRAGRSIWNCWAFTVTFGRSHSPL